MSSTNSLSSTESNSSSGNSDSGNDNGGDGGDIVHRKGSTASGGSSSNNGSNGGGANGNARIVYATLVGFARHYLLELDVARKARYYFIAVCTLSVIAAVWPWTNENASYWATVSDRSL